MQVAARLNWPCVRVNLDGHISRIDLIGKDAIVIRGGKQVTEFRAGILPWALQRNVVLVFDEYDAGRPDVMFVLQRVLEAEGSLTLLDQSVAGSSLKHSASLHGAGKAVVHVNNGLARAVRPILDASPICCTSSTSPPQLHGAGREVTSQWAYARLLRRSEPRRVLMVISDGAPLDDATLAANDFGYLDRHLRAVIASIQSAGAVELLAIGIGHDVGSYYSRAFTVTEPEELGEAMVMQLIALLERPLGRAISRNPVRTV